MAHRHNLHFAACGRAHARTCNGASPIFSPINSIRLRKRISVYSGEKIGGFFYSVETNLRSRNWPVTNLS